MTERRITFEVSIDLSKGSKEAHARTVRSIGRQIAEYSTELMEDYGYTVRQSKASTTMHYVRHVLEHTVKEPRRRKLKKVQSKTPTIIKAVS